MTRNQLLTLILQEVLRINDQTKYGAFYKYSGHVNALFIHISEGKDAEDLWIFDESIYMGAGMTDPMPKLRACLDHLKTYV